MIKIATSILKGDYLMSVFKKIMMWIGIVITTLVVIGIIIGVIAYYATGGLVSTINNQLSALKSGDIEKAYSYTAKDFQNVISLEDFKKFIKKYPSLSNNESASFTTREIQNKEGTVKGTLKAKDGAVTPIEYRLIKENDQWKILFIRLQPTGTSIKDETSNTSSSSSSTASQAKIDLSNLFEDKNNKYSIKYPADWIYDNSKKGTVVFSGKQGTKAFYTTVAIQTVLTKKTGGIYNNLEEFSDSLKKQAHELSNDVNFLAEGPVNLSATAKRIKMNGKYLVFTYTYKGVQFKQLQFVFERDDGQAFYAWGYTAHAEFFDVSYPIAKAMFGTWSVY